MTFDSFQEWTKTTAIYHGVDYPRLALAEEVGELLGKIAKFDRDFGWEPDGGKEWSDAYDKLKNDVLKEGGDVLWQLARVLDDLGISLGAAAAGNIVKLESRKKRNVLEGSGDDR